MNIPVKLCTIGLSLSLFISTALAFTDVPAEAWFASYVSALEDEGIIDSGELFRPAQTLNRAELVKMVMEAIGAMDNYEAPPTATFDDVPSEAWFSSYVEEAATRSIVRGYEDEQGNLTGVFGPADPVTRAAAVKILVGAFDISIPNGSSSGRFPDVHQNDWFADYVLAASEAGLVGGYSDGTFKPANLVTRAEMAKMLSLAINPEIDDEVLVEEEVIEEEVIEEEPTGEPAEANASILVAEVTSAGNNEKFVASYNFKGINEGFVIDTITVVNDTTGSTLGDDPVGTPAIKEVTLKFPNENGFLSVHSSALSNDGTARFSNLDFYVERDKDSFLEIYADLNEFSAVGPALSGETFRLGIQNVDNTTDTFRAVGAISGSTVTFGAGATLGSSKVEPFTIRKSSPTLELTENTGTLIDGQNTLFDLEITAASSGSIGLGRFVVEVSVGDNDGVGISLSNFKLFGGSGLIQDVMIYDATGGQDISPVGGGTLVIGQADVIISFDTEEIISINDTETYSLKATVTGSASGDSVSSLIADDETTQLSGLTASNNPNTGKIFVSGDATAGIFTGDTDFSRVLGTNKHFLWSDQSAQPHLYPTVAAGTVTTDTGSDDWTNGYRLGISALDPVVLSK